MIYLVAAKSAWVDIIWTGILKWCKLFSIQIDRRALGLWRLARDDRPDYGAAYPVPTDVNGVDRMDHRVRGKCVNTLGHRLSPRVTRKVEQRQTLVFTCRADDVPLATCATRRRRK